jgi:hypothetical protein
MNDESDTRHLNNLLGHELWFCSIENYLMGLPQAKTIAYGKGK